MRRPDPKRIFTSYAVAWIYLGGFIIAQVIYALLSPGRQAALTGWASTNVHNLSHDPLGSLVVSAFLTQGSAWAWTVLIALAMFGANGALGNWRTAVVCAAGQVFGTLVSEGIVGYRVARGLLPAADRPLVRGRVRDHGGPALRLVAGPGRGRARPRAAGLCGRHLRRAEQPRDRGG